MQNATFYSARTSPLTAEEVSAWLGGVEVSPRSKGLLRKRVVGFDVVHPAGSIQLSVMAEDELDEHLIGFEGFVRSQLSELGPNVVPLLTRIRAARLVLGCSAQPEVPMADVVAALCARLQAMAFLPGGILDEHGEELLDLSGHAPADDDASASSEDEDAEPDPPTAQRVAERALALCVVTYRALLEADEPDDAPELLDEVRRWARATGVLEHMEPAERALLDVPLGSAERRAVINGSWRSEGLGVLLWALGKVELPPHDEGFAPPELWRACGLLEPGRPKLLSAPRLRSSEALDPVFGQLLGLHWRLRDFGLRPQAMDYRAFAANCWFGEMSLEGIPLAEDDLAIKGQPIASASPDDVSYAHSIAMERHQAANWLQGDHAIYSKVDTST